MRIQSGKTTKAVIGVAVLGACLIASAGQIAAAPRSSVNQPSIDSIPGRVETALDANAAAAVLAKEGKTRDALGFPVGVKRVGRHVRDGTEQAEYDEVTEVDAAGRVQAITQFDTKGRLRTAVRLDTVPASLVRATREGAVKAAQKSALAAGLSVGTPTSTEPDEALGGWTIHWARLLDRVRVRGDETRVHVRPDGQIQSVALAEHDLAAAPATRIGPATGRQIAKANLDTWFANRSSGYRVLKTDLEWVGPNAAFDPTSISSAEVPFRLAWVTEAKPSGDAAETCWLISLFVDAADGNIIGGDFVE